MLIVLYSVFTKKQKNKLFDENTSSFINSTEVSDDYLEPTESQSNESIVKPTSNAQNKNATVNASNEVIKKEPTIDASANVSVGQEPKLVNKEKPKSSTATHSNLDLEARPTTANSIDKANLKPKLDPKTSIIITDLVAKIKNPLPIEQNELLTLFRLHDYKFKRKVQLFGLNQLTENWRDIEYELPSARFVELGLSIQLADRDGAMNEKELHDFQQMVLEFAEKFDAPFEFSMPIDDAYEQAQALDVIGRRYDSMAVLNIVSKTQDGFRAADLGSCARDLLMSCDKKGIYLKTIGQKDNISVLYRLAITDGAGKLLPPDVITGVSHDLVMYMNVPATKDPQAVFQEMIKDANSLATWLEGKVVDRNRHTMTDQSYSVLMQQIVDITESMKKDGLSPGDTVSKILF